MLKTKNELLVRRTKITTVDLPEVGEVGLRYLSLAEINAWTEKKHEGHGSSVELLALSICDDKGNRVFGDDALDELSAIDYATAKLLVDRALELNNLKRKEDPKQETADAVKN